MNSIGELIYDWDLITDRLQWGANLDQVLAPLKGVDLSSGMAFGDRLAAESATSVTMRSSNRSARTRGRRAISGRVRIERAARSGQPKRDLVEDVGRWFKGPMTARPRAWRHSGGHRTTPKGAASGAPVAIRPLTGAFNRAHLTEHVQRILDAANARESLSPSCWCAGESFALNRTYGYDAGDEVIAGSRRG